MGVDKLSKHVGGATKAEIAPVVLGPCFEAATVSPSYIEFCKLDGNRVALQYFLLTSVTFDASKGIVLEFGQHKVMLHGRRLEPAFAALADKLIARCSEGDERDGEPKDLPFVTRIDGPDVAARRPSRSKSSAAEAGDSLWSEADG